MVHILVRYAEIALKGANRYLFENQLQNNLKTSLRGAHVEVTRYQPHFVVKTRHEDIDYTLRKLGKVFGVAWYAPAERCKRTLDAITKASLELIQGKLTSGQRFAVRGQRSDKSLPFTSVDIEVRVGDAIRKFTGAQVDLDHPDVTLYVNVSFEGAYVHTQRIPGPGGLPVGTSGKVLALLSGGGDSIAAAYSLAKRGARVDFLHFHAFPHNRDVIDSKIATIATELSQATYSQSLFLAPYLPFQMQALDLEDNDDGYELVLFRRVMVRVAESIARDHDYKALILGDSLAQVASQTLENLVALDQAVTIPLFRPLIGMDKQDIRRLVKKTGLYRTAIAQYKDCCSIIARRPVTKAYLPKVTDLEDQLGIDRVVEEIVRQVEVVEVEALSQAVVDHPN
jgi:thiamine biosynthesis protein ThiI